MNDVKLLAPPPICIVCGTPFSLDLSLSDEMCEDCVEDAYEEQQLRLAEGPGSW